LDVLGLDARLKAFVVAILEVDATIRATGHCAIRVPSEVHEVVTSESDEASGHPLSVVSILVVIKLPEFLDGFFVISFLFARQSSSDNLSLGAKQKL
jgi:hypothetical protein